MHEKVFGNRTRRTCWLTVCAVTADRERGMARVLVLLMVAVAMCGQAQGARSRKGPPASSEQPPAPTPPAPPVEPAQLQEVGKGATRTAGQTNDKSITVKGAPVDYDLVYAIDDDSMEDLMAAIEHGALVNGCDATMTAFAAGHYRVITDKYYVPRKMHEKVIDSMRTVEPGFTPLHYMVLRSCPLLRRAFPRSIWPGPPNLDMMRVLLEHGASPNLQTQRSGRTPLMLAAAFGFTEAVELMLEFGAKVHLTSTYGNRDAATWAETVSHDGLIGGHWELARHLRDPETAKSARENSKHIVIRSTNPVLTENGCVCKVVWEDDDGRTQVACPASERWCKVEPGCDAAKEKRDGYDGWDECSAERNIKDVL